MFSSIAVFSYILCVKSGSQNCRDVDPKFNVVATCVADAITGISLLVIGCLALNGIIPCNTVGGGLMVGFGCLQLILTPLITIGNCCMTSMWDS